MFGYFMFAQPMFAEVPFFTGGGGGAAPGEGSARKDRRREIENEMEITLLAFLQTQE